MVSHALYKDSSQWKIKGSVDVKEAFAVTALYPCSTRNSQLGESFIISEQRNSTIGSSQQDAGDPSLDVPGAVCQKHILTQLHL